MVNDGNFSAGADIKLFINLNKKSAYELLNSLGNLINTIENLLFSTMSAVRGLCIGGGFELSLILQKIPSPGWFIAVSILFLGIPYLAKREKYMCPNCKRIYYKDPARFDWTGRLQAIIVIILLFAILILVELLLNRLFNH
jgi:hypothetical protein